MRELLKDAPWDAIIIVHCQGAFARDAQIQIGFEDVVRYTNPDTGTVTYKAAPTGSTTAALAYELKKAIVL